MPARHRRTAQKTLACAIFFACVAPAVAQTQAAAQSGVSLDVRYRFEHVDDTAIARDAEANTLRIRLGYRWVIAPRWQIFVEGAHVQSLFGAHYNSTANGKTTYPIVVDPQSSQINQASLTYAGDALLAVLGRQRIVLDNQRFFGNSGWRQNEQTFDAVSARYTFANGGPVIGYIHLADVQRVNGHDNPNALLREWSLNGHLLNLSQALPVGTLTGYGYWVENRDIATLSTRSAGLRWTGSREVSALKLGWAFEYANQSDWGNNPLALSADYRLIESSLTWQGVTFKAGQEILGGNGRYGFATPYATLHAFNGWADRFGTTPRNGLDDRYIGADGRFGAAAWALLRHDYRADHGGQAYGREWDAQLTYPLRRNLGVLLKYANYQADGFSVSGHKFWASVEYRY